MGDDRGNGAVTVVVVMVVVVVTEVVAVTAPNFKGPIHQNPFL